jgi:hypothetical protein
MAGQGLMYSANISGVSSGTASTDVLVLGTSSAVSVLIHEIRMTSAATTDVRLNLQICRRSTAPTGGAAITPRALNPRNTVAATATVTSLPTVVGTIGNILDPEQWSVLVPYSRIYTPDERILVNASSWVALFFATAPGSASTISAEFLFEEL